MELRISFVDLDKQLENGIIAEITKKINRVINKSVNGIHKRFAVVVINNIKQTPEYQDIISGGDLLHELGLPDATVIDDIVEAVAKNIQIKYSSSIGRVLGKITVSAIRSDYSDLLTLPAASYTYSTSRGVKTIEWLRWLLLEGTSSIVLDYDVDLTITKNSRTGYGIMVKNTGKSWDVPPEFAGVAGDNFLTRAMVNISTELDTIVRQELSKAL